MSHFSTTQVALRATQALEMRHFITGGEKTKSDMFSPVWCSDVQCHLLEYWNYKKVDLEMRHFITLMVMHNQKKVMHTLQSFPFWCFMALPLTKSAIGYGWETIQITWNGWEAPPGIWKQFLKIQYYAPLPKNPITNKKNIALLLVESIYLTTAG